MPPRQRAGVHLARALRSTDSWNARGLSAPHGRRRSLAGDKRERTAAGPRAEGGGAPQGHPEARGTPRRGATPAPDTRGQGALGARRGIAGGPGAGARPWERRTRTGGTRSRRGLGPGGPSGGARPAPRPTRSADPARGLTRRAGSARPAGVLQSAGPSPRPRLFVASQCQGPAHRCRDGRRRVLESRSRRGGGDGRRCLPD